MPADRILIVEDESQFAKLVERYLTGLGYEVADAVDSGDAALAAARKHEPDLALLDVEIVGQMDGFDVAERLRAEHDVPVIFLTGRSDDATMERVRRSECFGYLLKPFRPEELKAAVELALIRHGHESYLRKIEQSFSAAVKSIVEAVIMTDAANKVTYLNPAAERLTGRPGKRALGQDLKDVFQVVKDAGETPGKSVVDQWLAGGGRPEFVYEVTLLTAAKREVPVEVTVSGIRDGIHGVVGSVLVFRDITERKRFEAQLRKSESELRSLAGHLEAAREAERTRIAREIHDEFGQLLTAFKMDVSWLEKRLGDAAAVPPAALRDKVHSMNELLREMVQSVRRIAAELRPGALDDLGLAAAVEWQAKEFQQRAGIKCRVQSVLGDDELPPLTATALFRVLQESLTNVARHAEAKNVRVELGARDGNVILEVADDGRGITDQQINKPGAFGLMGMRERVAPLRGKVEIRGKSGSGTMVRITVPRGSLETKEAKHD